MDLRRKATEGKSVLITLYQEFIESAELFVPVDGTLISRLRKCLLGFSAVKLLSSPPLSILYLWLKKNPLCTSNASEWRVIIHFFENVAST